MLIFLANSNNYKVMFPEYSKDIPRISISKTFQGSSSIKGGNEPLLKKVFHAPNAYLSYFIHKHFCSFRQTGRRILKILHPRMDHYLTEGILFGMTTYFSQRFDYFKSI